MITQNQANTFLESPEERIAVTGLNMMADEAKTRDTLPTPQTLRIDDEVISMLRCPTCQDRLDRNEKEFFCGSGCGLTFPIAQGVPVVVDPAKSLFDLEIFVEQQPTFFRPVSPWRERLSRWIPDLSRNIAAADVYEDMRDRLNSLGRKANVLVVGGGVTGGGMECLLDQPNIRLIETDAAVAPRTQLICDGHDLPFADESMDGVIVQAVLEHVVDPHRCVEEIFRVLKPSGLVYSDTPFMQQVHGRQFDFTRFTRLGHRRLFRQFDAIREGITCGPAMALAWNYRYFLMSVCDHPKYRALASAFARCTAWPLLWVDPFLAKSAAANDAASAFFFLGKKSERVLSDRELVRQYVGGQ
ncbi:MAG: methyltransferase domain-containing protein [Planctomycetota bacterium]